MRHQSARTSTYSDRATVGIPLAPIAVACVIACVVTAAVRRADGSAPKAPEQRNRDATERAALEREYRALKTERHLAELAAPYLVIDVPRSMLSLKLRGAVVWESPISPEAGSDSAAAFASSFVGDEHSIAQAVRGRHLYTFSERTPDSVLTIVSEVVHAETDLMQRIIPGKFTITWKNNATLEVRTDAPCRPKSRFGNMLEGMRQAARKRRGGATLVTRMEAERAVTLYRVAKRGLPTLIYAQ